MVPVDILAGEVDRNPPRRTKIGRARIGLRIGVDQHRLLVKPAGAHADDRLVIAMMIVAKLRELLAVDEESRLAVRDALLGFGEFQRRLADAVEGDAHRLTNSLNARG